VYLKTTNSTIGSGPVGLRWLFVVLLYLTQLAAQGLNAQVQATVDTTQMRIGEELEFLIQVQADSTDFVMFPEGKSFGAFEVIRSYAVDTLRDDSNKRRWQLRKKYGLTQFDSGYHRLSKQRVMINDSAYDTPEFDVAVLTIPVDTTQQQIFTIKPSAQVPLQGGPIWPWMILLGLVLLGLAFWFWRRKQVEREAFSPPPLPPYQEAVQRLEKVLNQEPNSQGALKDCYSELTDILKTYIHREIDSRALESTTDELLDRLGLHQIGDHFSIETQTIDDLGQILRRADLIKFAKAQVTLAQWNLDFSEATLIIESLKASIPEPEQEDEQAALDAAAKAELLAKQKRKRRLIFSAAAVFAVLAAYVVYVGPQEAKDQIFGNAMRDMAEGSWYKSEYGVPAVILESPEILVRKIYNHPDQDSLSARGTAIFEAFTLKDEFYVAVTSTEAIPHQNWDIAMALNRSLVLLEEQGARTLIVKDESFETPEGIKGLRAYGSFYVANASGKVGAEQHQYELLVFDQQGGIQTVMVAYVDDNRFAQGLKERIINSVSLEIPQTQQKPEAP
jgi:LPXTG-motif cell wall-anchored protein